MPIAPEELLRFLSGVHPYDALEADALESLVPQFVQRRLPAGEPIYAYGNPLEGLYLIHSGQVEIRDENEVVVSLLGPRNSFGERGLARDGIAATSARTVEDTLLFMLPVYAFNELVRERKNISIIFRSI